ncbi:serine/threonine-protein phosphatase 2A 55 kDa regulatory subunit B alpha isoform [Octopus bimaculoides]|uniref:serine/threonine-protein phosphatase 2A 55 kDa regulatory subunit B alpha isoform n=1 Tax=Octopus bimaculoides TaxID=37653 RepID=UPI0022E3223F|nr:serine/threonine-protein phosphatase 2A 55 kDa regulatory subunit B alpha isoform [Octopus bimaculoides]
MIWDYRLRSSTRNNQMKTAENGNGGEIQWCFSQVKGTIEEDITEADIISCVEFNSDGELLATGDKGGRVVIFQHDKSVSTCSVFFSVILFCVSFFFFYICTMSCTCGCDACAWCTLIRRVVMMGILGFVYFCPSVPLVACTALSLNNNNNNNNNNNDNNDVVFVSDKTIKLWKVTERDKRPEGYNLKDEGGLSRDSTNITALRVPVFKPMELLVEASPRRIFANAHTYHINSISVNSDQETYLSADDLRINLWHLEVTDQSFNIVDIKPANMEELTEVITAAEFHPTECSLFVYSSSKGTIRLCDMRAQALCDRHAKLFEEPEDPTNRSFFSEIISSISDVKFSHNGRYMITRDYLSVKVWDLQMDSRPIETYQVHEYLRNKLCSLYENDCIFDKFECAWSGGDRYIMTGSYNNFFRMFDRETKRDITLEACRENMRTRTILKPRKVCTGSKRKKDEISVDCLDFSKKILHTAWHPLENILAVAATNNLYIFHSKD